MEVNKRNYSTKPEGGQICDRKPMNRVCRVLLHAIEICFLRNHRMNLPMELIAGTVMQVVSTRALTHVRKAGSRLPQSVV